MARRMSGNNFELGDFAVFKFGEEDCRQKICGARGREHGLITQYAGRGDADYSTRNESKVVENVVCCKNFADARFWRVGLNSCV